MKHVLATFPLCPTPAPTGAKVAGCGTRERTAPQTGYLATVQEASRFQPNIQVSETRAGCGHPRRYCTLPFNHGKRVTLPSAERLLSDHSRPRGTVVPKVSVAHDPQQTLRLSIR